MRACQHSAKPSHHRLDGVKMLVIQFRKESQAPLLEKEFLGNWFPLNHFTGLRYPGPEAIAGGFSRRPG